MPGQTPNSAGSLIARRSANPIPLTTAHNHCFALFERGLRAPSSDPETEMVTYGTTEILRAAEFGAIQALLTIGPIISNLTRAVVKHGGKLFEFSDSSTFEHQRLAQFGGVCVLLRFPVPMVYSGGDGDDGDDGDGTDDLPLSIGAEKPTANVVVTEEVSEERAAPPHPHLPKTILIASVLASISIVTEANLHLNEETAEELDSMTAIYPQDFAHVPGTRSCLMSARSDDGLRAVVLRVCLPYDYPQNAAIELQILEATTCGVEEAALLQAGQSCCNSNHGEPSLFALMVSLTESLEGVAVTKP